MHNDAVWPELGDDMVRIRFRGGHLNGAVLDLPVRLSDVLPGRLVVTADGVYDRTHDCRPIRPARVLRAPTASRSVHTPAVCADYI